MNRLLKHLTISTVTFGFFMLAGAPLPVSVFKATSAEAYTKSQWRQARRACRKSYGKRLIKTRISKKGKIICEYRRSGRSANKLRTYADVVKFCRKRYKGNVTINAYKKYGKWYCSWRE